MGHALFNGFDTDCDGEVSLGQFLAGIAILLKGSKALKEEFYYWCLALDSEERYLTADALFKISRTLRPSHKRAFHDRLVDDIFTVSSAASNERLTVEEFRRWTGTKFAPYLLSWFGACHVPPSAAFTSLTIDPCAQTWW